MIRSSHSRAVVVGLMALFALAPAFQPATAATWKVIEMEKFESSWPDSLWAIRDRNGPDVGGVVVWDDNSQRAHQGSWAAHPSDGGPYPNLVDTFMRYGPFSLVGALNANVSFWYWLDTEAGYDEFGWQYSCNDGKTWTRTQVSGSRTTWTNVIVSLKPCLGKAKVFVRWTFESDYSNPSSAPLGVWVDTVKIQKRV